MATALDPSTPEYATLKEMFGALVDNLADNASVIPQLNTHLHASGLIARGVFNTARNSGNPYERCNSMLTPVLAKVDSNPACFHSLVESLKKVELYDIVFKLEEKLQSEQKSRESEKNLDYEIGTSYESHKPEECKKSSYAISSASEDKVSHPIPFPYVHTPPTLTYAMIDKMMERGGSFNDKAMSTQQSDSDTKSSASALQQFSKHFSYVKEFLKKKSIKINEEPKRRMDSFNSGKANHDVLIGHFQDGRYRLSLSSLLSCTDSEYVKSVTSSEEYDKANLLHWAAYWGWIDIINKLIDDHSFDPMYTDAIGRTAAHFAVLGRKLEVIELLTTKHHCNPVCKDLKGRTPLFVAMERGCFNIIKYYMTSLGYDSCDGKPLGIVAAEHGHLDILKYFIEECKFNVNETSEDDTALDVAAIFGHLEIMKYLIVECKCNPNKKKRYSMKPLHHASKNGHTDIVKYLVSKCNCNVHEARKGLSPLQYAAGNRHFGLVKYFIEECDCNAESALQHAGSVEILKFLSEKSGKNPGYNASLDNAIKGKHAEVVKYLVAKWGKDTDLTNRLLEPIRCQNFQTVDFLINECQVNVTNIDSKGRSLLHYAAEGAYTHNGVLVVQCLLAAGLDPLKKDAKGMTPLAIAMMSSYWWNSDQFFDAFGKTKTMYPVDSYVNVLIVGNSGAGKSTLSKVIEKTTDHSFNFLRELSYISPNEVELLTAGIVPIKLDHKQLRNIILHDFAGQSEYYLSHTAVIENILQESAAVIIIVVDVSNHDYLIHLKQWLAVVRNETQKAKDDCKVIVVASHFDCLKTDSEKKIVKNCIKLELNDGDDIGYLDCRKLGGEKLRSFFLKLENACSTIRDNDKRSLTLYCHMMYKLLQSSKKDVLTLLDIVKNQIKNADYFLLPFDGKQILNILSSLHSTGLIYYLNCEDRDRFVFDLKLDSDGRKSYSLPKNCKVWVVVNKMILLKNINGIIFSPITFKEHPNIAENGIITVPFLKSLFPDYDLLMIISFLESMGLCHIVSPLFLLQTNLVKEKDEINAEDTFCLFFLLLSIFQDHQMRKAFALAGS
ncbi:PREDICTED: uncharacterized protein LOC109587445 isoform X1 [Amphimedon queenslandica]|uniref:Non-specific serine/threonine protein kinase n=1 Tax=Amphimedon queenslandica TaxID=400682 RepID=A0AAN0JQB5_AMPQE|nr:PREDICTED: uncharacterized protein LOC109587445 isoform X1 [Amphimedon queenslandica]|eukprot:XP_019859241.1 PREDICTED: uncharacterized protein LOC109587445 isoform X1 [Amphimedon queenslandica]